MLNKERLRDHLKYVGKDRSWEELGKLYGLTTETARHVWRRFRKENLPTDNASTAMKQVENSKEQNPITSDQFAEVNRVSAEFSKPIATAEALMKELEIDPKTVTVKKFWSNRKEIKERDGSISAIYNVTAEFVPKQKKENVAEQAFKEFVESYAGLSLPVEIQSKVDPNKDNNILILSLTDLHLDKKAYKEEVGEDSGLVQSYTRAIAATIDLVGRARKGYDIEKIIIVGGNDFFHANSSANTTAKGTPLDVDGRWHQSFRQGLKLLTTIIDFCKQYAEVDFINVNGNHGPERDFYLAVALEAFYRNDKSVTIESLYTERKYFYYGNSVFLLTHDLGRRAKDLPVIFATERPDLFAKCKYRTILTGHLHKHQEVSFIGTNENYGIIYKILPSLSSTDLWHHNSTFINNNKSCIGLIVNESYGTIDELIYNE